MLRSENVECVSLYCGADGIRNVIERIGNNSVLEIIQESESEAYKPAKELENTIIKLKYLKSKMRTKIDSSINDETECEKIEYNEAVSKVSELYEKLVFLKNFKKDHKKSEFTLEQNIKMMEISRKFTNELKSPLETTVEFNFQPAIFESSKKLMMKKMLKRRLRENVYFKSYETTLDSRSGNFTIFIIYALGDENQALAKKIVESLGGRVFECIIDKEKKFEKIQKSHREVKRVIKSTGSQITSLFETLNKSFDSLSASINKENEMCKAMSKLTKIEECYTGKGWVLNKDLEKLEKLKSFGNENGRFFFEVSKSELVHPTHFEPSQFARAFQDLTNVFGVPKYREINPAIFMLFTFPFLFGAMFGDILHGLILFAISLLMITFYTKINGKCGVFQIILDGRFVVFACSLASIWFGFLYGDFGSLPVSLFASQYETGRTYPFGIDPVWHHADNKMVFVNSVKMKLSLIIGFIHMGLGAVISISNAMYFKSKIDLICMAIPQFIAFFAFLGYLVFLCFYKWIVTINRPSIVNTLIAMYTDPFRLRDQMYPGQMYVQVLVFSFILITVPWMIFSKPLYMILKKKVPNDGMLDLWIGSGIHTVEFCLGLISNTSSYLRLWAVSLAHVQLTSVLHEFTIGNSKIIVKILSFPIYLAGTFMLLIGLEGLSACLHALRLNWIEFFSKFYSGGGTEFKPLNFNLKDEE